MLRDYAIGGGLLAHGKLAADIMVDCFGPCRLMNVILLAAACEVGCPMPVCTTGPSCEQDL